MNLRDKRQWEFADRWYNTGQFGILHLCPRFGKIYTSINILEKYFPSDARILITYPDNKIKDSWIEDFKKRNYTNNNIAYTSHLSLHKYKDEYDLIIIDEIHLLSNNQINVCKDLFKYNSKILGLSGTISNHTETKLNIELDLYIVGEYPIELGIEEGVIVDYEIRIIKTKLDDKIINKYKTKSRTEKGQFKALSFVINKLEEDSKNTKFLRLSRMRIIQNSISKINVTKKLLKEFENERVLVFGGTISSIEKLNISTHHSKSKSDEGFNNFVSGGGNHLAVVKIGNAGITYKPLNKVIISYFNSNSENLTQQINRCMSMEYNNPDKKAIIYIITTDEPVELRWLTKALEFFDKEKIKYYRLK